MSKGRRMSTAVYRAYDTDGGLLYVGVTGRLGRLHEHRRSSAWWLRAVQIGLEHFESREAALEVERIAIATERPTYNLLGCLDEHIPGEAALRRARVNKGMSIIELAAASGISPEQIRNIETGRAPTPRAKTLSALAAPLGIEPADIDPVLASDAPAAA